MQWNELERDSWCAGFCTRGADETGQRDSLVPPTGKEAQAHGAPCGSPARALGCPWSEQRSGTGRNAWKWKGSQVSKAGSYLGKEKREEE